MNKHQSTKEYLIVGLAFAAILFPARLLFVTVLGENWFGSFGLLATLLILVFYLSEKGKLGKFGEIFQRRMKGLHAGKKRYFIYSTTAVYLLFWAVSVGGIQYGETYYPQQIDEIHLFMTGQARSIDQSLPTFMFETYPAEKMPEFTFRVLTLPFADFEAWAITISTINRMFDNFYLHFATVFLVESLEVTAMLIYTRFKSRQKQEIIS